MMENQEDRSREEIINSAKKRFKSFRAKQTQCDSMTPSHKPQRSHSRGASITTPPTLSTPKLPATSTPSPKSRPSSQHRRRESMTTRRESAEIMGLPVPEEKKADDRDDVRLHALWALEGKTRPLSDKILNGFSQVEIPEWTTPDAEKNFDWSEPKSPSVPSAFGGSSMRDSFGKITPSSSNKSNLGTLLEEEEEEETEAPEADAALPTTVRHRPANLDLRTLVLPSQPTTNALPTPSSTPSPRVLPPGLKTLTLAVIASTPSRRQQNQPASNPLPSPTDIKAQRRASGLSYRSSLSSDTTRSSMSSNPRASVTLLTPALTPTSDRPRSLSPADQAYLAQAHASLLSRITDLEKALESRTVNPVSRPSDEILSLLSDLKAERDELTRDVEGWRQRCADLEKQVGLGRRHVDMAQREAWVSREKFGQLEVEKDTIEREKAQLEELVAELRRIVDDLREELERERIKREELEHELGDALMTPTVRNVKYMPPVSASPRRFRSYASGSTSSTDVDDPSSSFGEGVRLKMKTLGADHGMMEIVEEQDEDADEDELAHYEDEGSDVSFHSQSYGSSMSSLLGDSPPRVPPAHSPLPSPLPVTPENERREDLTRNWTFPSGPAPAPKPKAKVDRFFKVLEDFDAQEEESDSKEPFTWATKFGADSANEDDVDDSTMFCLPTPEPQRPLLEAVMEEEEEEEEEVQQSTTPTAIPVAMAKSMAKSEPFSFPLRKADVFETSMPTAEPRSAAACNSARPSFMFPTRSSSPKSFKFPVRAPSPPIVTVTPGDFPFTNPLSPPPPRVKSSPVLPTTSQPSSSQPLPTFNRPRPPTFTPSPVTTPPPDAGRRLLPEDTRPSTPVRSPISSRISLQSLTSLLPISWSPRQNKASLCLVPESDSYPPLDTTKAIEKVTRLASREKQLERLRAENEAKSREMCDKCSRCKGRVFVV